MATCIQLASHRGEDFTSCGSALPDALPAHVASRPRREKQPSQKFTEEDTPITAILDLIELSEA